MSKCNFGILQDKVFFKQIDSVHISNEEERANYCFEAELDKKFSKIVTNNQIKLLVKIINKFINYKHSCSQDNNKFINYKHSCGQDNNKFKIY